MKKSKKSTNSKPNGKGKGQIVYYVREGGAGHEVAARIMPAAYKLIKGQEFSSYGPARELALKELTVIINLYRMQRHEVWSTPKSSIRVR